MALVKYQVERRPIDDKGKVYRGLGGDNADYIKAGSFEVKGEPWVVHSTHFSLESALASAAPLATAIGSDNLRIVKVITGGTEFKLQ